MKYCYLALFIILTLLSSCMSPVKLTEAKNVKFVDQVVKTEVGKEMSSNIGDVVYMHKDVKKFIYEVYRNKEAFKFAKPYFNAWDGINFNKDDMVELAKDSLTNYFNISYSNKKRGETWIEYSKLHWENMGYKGDTPNYFVVKDGKIYMIAYAVSVDRKFLINPPVEVELTTVERVQKNNFSYELIYQGIQSNSIVFAYREYTEDLIRSSYSQNLYYNLDELQDRIIQYKNVKIKVISYSNQKITYIILEN